MKFYDCTTAPSPRRVRIFMAEKNITNIPIIQVDLRAGEQLGDAFRALNPWCTVPVLELDDGTCISEIGAICRVLEVEYPDPPLLGRSATEQGVIEMWNHHCEMDGFHAVAEAFRNTSKGFSGRALAGPANYDQIPALAERGRARTADFFAMLDERLADSPYIAGDTYSNADITAQTTVDFAGWIKLGPEDGQENLHRWHEEVSARPSAAA